MVSVTIPPELACMSAREVTTDLLEAYERNDLPRIIEVTTVWDMIGRSSKKVERAKIAEMIVNSTDHLQKLFHAFADDHSLRKRMCSSSLLGFLLLRSVPNVRLFQSEKKVWINTSPQHITTFSSIFTITNAITNTSRQHINR